MEKTLTISTKPFPAHEDGITQAVQNGFLFRSQPELDKLYREGYRVQSYYIPSDTGKRDVSPSFTIKVLLVK